MRLIVIGIALLYLAVGALLFALGLSGWIVAWSVFEASVLVGALLLERWRYRPPTDRQRGRWQSTGERFVDPSTGHLVEVFFNPDTGERDYRDVGQGQR